MDIIDILDKKVKDAVERELKLRNKISSLENEIEKLNEGYLDLQKENSNYKNEIGSILGELDRVVRDLDI
jgi:FtsZ-binding cell division protein ZapB